jgi:hypothetical protein
MMDTLAQVLDTLATAHTPVSLFLRDDDAGWDDARLIALLDVTQRVNVPIDLAAIPLAVGNTLARELCGRMDSAPGLLGVHQHGYAHTNHQAEGRACEFGYANDPDSQRLDLERGRALLLQHFGSRLDALFTPPWNRCAASTPGLLAELGYTALSRDRSATPQYALPELSVDVDWCKHYRVGGVDAVTHALARATRARIEDGCPLGLMLHHAAMDAWEVVQLEELLRALSRHSKVRWAAMRELCTTLKTLTFNPTCDFGGIHET